jgi:hypothetical protein
MKYEERRTKTQPAAKKQLNEKISMLNKIRFDALIA